jgi:Protein of unknown function (DUF3634)
MLLQILIGLLIVAVLLVWLGFVPPPHAVTLIRVRNGVATVKKGHVRSDALEAVSQILREAGVAGGFIAVMGDNKLVFSRKVPPQIHQRVRNVLLNQWA